MINFTKWMVDTTAEWVDSCPNCLPYTYLFNKTNIIRVSTKFNTIYWSNHRLDSHFWLLNRHSDSQILANLLNPCLHFAKHSGPGPKPREHMWIFANHCGSSMM